MRESEMSYARSCRGQEIKRLPSIEGMLEIVDTYHEIPQGAGICSDRLILCGMSVVHPCGGAVPTHASMPYSNMRDCLTRQKHHQIVNDVSQHMTPRSPREASLLCKGVD